MPDGLGPIAIGFIIFFFLVGLAIAGFLAFRLIRGFRAVQSEYMPVGGKVAFWLSLAYALFPIDVLPEPIFIDDIGVLAGALVYINHLIRTNFPEAQIDPLDPADPDQPL